MSTETTNKKIKIDNGTTFGRTYTDKAVDELLKNAGGGGIPTANMNAETSQLDTSSLTAKDQYILASSDDGAGNIDYIPLQTYLLNDGYFNKEVKMQINNHDFRLTLTDVSFQSYNNYAFNAKNTNVDFTNTLDGSYTWNKLGDIKYIAIEEQNVLTGEYTYDYLEISGGGTNIPSLPADASTKNYALNSVNGTLTWNTIGNGLEIKDGVIKVKQETQVFNLNSENVIPFYNTDLSSMLGYKLKITNNTNAKTYGKTFIEKLLNKDKYNKIAKASISLLEPNTLNLYCEITNLYPIVMNGSAPSLYSIMYFSSLAIISIYCDADNNDFIIDFRLAHPDETTLAQIQQILNLIANGGVIRFNLLGE